MIEGALVRLRAFEPEDAPLSYVRINDPDVCRHLARRYPLSMADQVKWSSDNSVGFTNAKFAIETKDTREFIGGCDLRCDPPEVRAADLGIAISDKTKWEQGFGSDAMRTLCRFGFDEMNLQRISLWVHATNERAIHVYTKLGFVHEGTAREAWYQDGGYVDMHLMGLLREDFTRTG